MKGPKRRGMEWIRFSAGVVACGVGLLAPHARAESENLNTGIDEALIDRSVQPCQDFYQFSCGKWLETAQIPADLPMWDRSFMAIREKNRLILKNILEKYASGQFEPKNPYAKKLGDFYAACMDEESAEKSSLNELKRELRKIDALNSKDFNTAFAKLLAEFHLSGVNAFFDFGDQQDFKDATKVIGVVDQAGLSLPDRDYYLKDDPKTLEIRSAFLKYAQTILEWLGASASDAQEQAKKILNVETYLAKNSMSRVDRRDPFKVYHRLERKGLKEKMPLFDWNAYFTKSGVSDVRAINVTVPEYFESLNGLLASVSERRTGNDTTVSKSPVGSLADLKIYLKWHVASGAIRALPKKFVDEEFRFVSQSFSGQKELEARWKRCVKAVDSAMGFALGRSFVDISYGREGKVVTSKMIQSIEAAFQADLQDLDWMDNPTKEHALKKLHAIVNKVGYPDVWRNYDFLKPDRKSYIKTLARAATFNSKYHLNKIGKPLNRKEWEMSPPTVNAYYDPSMNEMVFPAGILQPPFFNKEAGMEANFGGIGMVMGHELTHGFDDQGRRYDASGNLVEWWSPSVSKAFEERATCVEKEYDAFEALPGLHLNGKLTLGENIADHGGIRLAYRAWTRSRQTSEKNELADKNNSLTDEQKFFVAFAQSWCSKKQDQFARMLVKTDPHSPPRFRVNGTVSQFDKFSDAFQCKKGLPMAPEKRCVIW